MASAWKYRSQMAISKSRISGTSTMYLEKFIKKWRQKIQEMILVLF